MPLVADRVLRLVRAMATNTCGERCHQPCDAQVQAGLAPAGCRTTLGAELRHACRGHSPAWVQAALAREEHMCCTSEVWEAGGGDAADLVGGAHGRGGERLKRGHGHGHALHDRLEQAVVVQRRLGLPAYPLHHLRARAPDARRRQQTPDEPMSGRMY